MYGPLTGFDGVVILTLETGSPLSLYDFYMYLKYIEFSPENLEFYIWFKNYDLMFEKNETEKHQTSLHSTSSTTTLANDRPRDDHELTAKTSQSDLDLEAGRAAPMAPTVFPWPR